MAARTSRQRNEGPFTTRLQCSSYLICSRGMSVGALLPEAPVERSFRDALLISVAAKERQKSFMGSNFRDVLLILLQWLLPLSGK